ncbi:MAG: hypothetical protein WD875_03190 [Pirellulales bacterium]
MSIDVPNVSKIIRDSPRSGTSRVIFPHSTKSLVIKHKGEEYRGLLLRGTDEKKDERVQVVARYDDAARCYKVLVESTIPLVIRGQFRDSIDKANGEEEPPDDDTDVVKKIDAGTHALMLAPDMEKDKGQ